MANKNLILVRFLGSALLGFAILIIGGLIKYIPLSYSVSTLLLWAQGILFSTVLIAPAIGLFKARSFHEFGKSYNHNRQKVLVYWAIVISISALFFRVFFE